MCLDSIIRLFTILQLEHLLSLDIKKTQWIKGHYEDFTGAR